MTNIKIEQWDNLGDTNTTNVKVCIETSITQSGIIKCEYYRFNIEGRYDSITEEMKALIYAEFNLINT